MSRRLAPSLSVLLLTIGLLAGCGSTSTARSIVTPSLAIGRSPSPAPRPIRTAVANGGASWILLTPQPTLAPTRAPDDLLRFVGKDLEPLPDDYVPPDLVPLPAQMSVPAGLLLRNVAAQAYEQMWARARQDGVDFVAVSTYRSYQDQVQVYANEVASFGQAKADSESARPGRSEHQLGLAIDLSSPAFGYALDDNFDKSPEGKWIGQHAADYGFVISYPADKDAITGYRFEPWHIRYVGVDAARAIVASGETSTEALESWRSTTAGPTPLPATPAPSPSPR